ncbi:amino acid adenylation domain-containing protein [Paenibacillus lentus]|uniref:amino acid adenylation domain-containing protein n=1 Tax=Paenibacillus lentus TaxID=1338368 RepID=UPI003650303F
MLTYPLSYPQQRIWYTEKIYPNTGLGNIIGLVKIKSKCDPQMISEAINQMIFENDIVRARFAENDDHEAYQYISEYRPISFPCLDFSNEQNNEELNAWISRFKQERFSLTDDLFSFRIVKLQDETWIFLKMHHLICDGFSMVFMIQQIIDNLISINNNGQGQWVGQARPSYLDYIVQEKEYESSKRFEKDQFYWKEKFSTIPENVSLKNSDVFATSIKADRLRIIVSDELRNSIMEYCTAHQMSMYTLFLAVMNIYLSKVLNTEDIVIGTNLTNRTNSKEKNTCGMFTSTLAFRNRVDKSMSFTDFTKHIFREQMSMIRHQRYPYNLILKDLRDQESSLNRLFAISVLYQVVSLESREDLAYETDYLFSEHETDDFGLHIKEWLNEGMLTFDFEYRTELFSEDEIREIANQLLTLTESALSDPGQTIGKLGICPAADRKKILEQWNLPRVADRDLTTFAHYFESSVLKNPHKEAVVLGEQSLTYDELNRRANQFARRLRKLGVRPETHVGVIAERSIETIVAVVAIWKAGGAFIPIDPKYPDERINYLISDSQCHLLLIQPSLMERFNRLDNSSENRGTVVVLNARDWEEEEDGNLPIDAEPDHLAYMIYTSGTTGNPKGVMVEHRQYMNVSLAWREEYELSSYPVNLLQIAGFSFDVFTGDLSRALLNNGKLVICPDETRLDLPAMYAWLEKYEITIFESTPALIIPLMEYIYDHKLPIHHLRLLILGADICSVVDYKKLLDRFGHQMRIINSYGVTEATIDTSYYEAPPEKVAKTGNTPIGRPLRNMNMYVIDDDNNLQPIGIVGELCIGGAGITRGYWNKPELTEQKFVDNPFAPGEKMYRTGDLARWNQEGFMEFLGRTDFQVKINGYRIELGEIESALLKHPNIRETCVNEVREAEGQPKICAYYVANSNLDKPEELKQYLVGMLPPYMVPSYFVEMERLPITANGKVDRTALPAPNYVPSTSQSVGARNETEEIMLDLWRECLGIDTIGITHNFFEAGGDSIKAMRLISRMHQRGLDVEVKFLFQYPTIAGICPYVRQVKRNIDQGVVEGEIPLTPIMAYFFEQNFASPHHWNQAVMLHRGSGFDPNFIKQTLEAMILHHDMLRATYNHQGMNTHVNNRGLNGELYRLRSVDIRGAASLSDRIQDEADLIQSDICLEEGPLVSAGLFHTDDGDHLLLCIHHLVIDGVSWRILLEDFNTAYAALVNNETIALPEKTNSFRDYAYRMEKYRDDFRVLQEADYWVAQQQKKAGKIQLDYDIQECQENSTRKLTSALSRSDTQRLLLHSNQAYNTEINDLLLSALGLALKDWMSEEKTAVIYLESHGRELPDHDIDLTRTVGWFTAIFPVVLDMSQINPISHYIKMTKENLRKVPGKGVGYGILKYLTPASLRPNLSFTEQPQVMFNYLGQLDEMGEYDSFKLSNLPTGRWKSPDGYRECPLEIDCFVQDGSLIIQVGYSEVQFRHLTIERFVQSYKQALLTVIDHCTGKTDKEITPSDVGYSKISLEDFQKLNELINMN